MRDTTEEARALVDIVAKHDAEAARRLSEAMGSPFDPTKFVENGDIWGGMGSLIDCLAMNCPSGRAGRRECEHAVIKLVDALKRSGVSSHMTDRWVGIFRRWEDEGI